MSKKFTLTIFGRNPILWAVYENLLSWFVRTIVPSWKNRLIPVCTHEVDQDDKNSNSPEKGSNKNNNNNTRCIVIGRPGGIEQLRVLQLKPGTMTCGYNLGDGSATGGAGGPFVTESNALQLGAGSSSEKGQVLVVVKVEAFSVNYADCCIRWGLYESANQYVGYPICPGFDVAGIVERVVVAGDSSSSSSSTTTANVPFQVGDRVFGCSLFGAYSTRVLIPDMQLRKIPASLTMEEAASIPAVALTALYALFLAGQYFPSSGSDSGSTNQEETHLGSKNRAILIHSAAGGVGSMLCQMAKILGMSPIVGVVGRSDKVDAAKALGCDVVIDKSACRNMDQVWEQIRAAVPGYYSTIMECNGVATLQQSYQHLCPMGRLIVYGFHSNLPLGRDMLSPWEWIQMARKMWFQMPTFDVMNMGTQNKSIMAFNLSFFAQEREMLSRLFDQVKIWLEQGKLHCPRITTFAGLERIAEAHELIQSGKSVGKIIISTTTNAASSDQ
ncbi:hypothetical protein ACA910_006688 [Epithemia clementina (nom. ined.)]